MIVFSLFLRGPEALVDAATEHRRQSARINKHRRTSGLPLKHGTGAVPRWNVRSSPWAREKTRERERARDGRRERGWKGVAEQEISAATTTYDSVAGTLDERSRSIELCLVPSLVLSLSTSLLLPRIPCSSFRLPLQREQRAGWMEGRTNGGGFRWLAKRTERGERDDRYATIPITLTRWRKWKPFHPTAKTRNFGNCSIVEDDFAGNRRWGGFVCFGNVFPKGEMAETGFRGSRLIWREIDGVFSMINPLSWNDVLRERYRNVFEKRHY